MALYFLKGEENPPPSPSGITPVAKKGDQVRTGLLTAGLIAILAASVIEASGFLRPWESRLPELLGLPSPVRAGTVFLSLPDTSGGEPDPMDTILLLRGLSMLHPSLILLATQHPPEGDVARLFQGVKDRLREQGIRLAEASIPSPESLWQPVPLCRYLPPGSLCQNRHDGSLPSVAGKAPAEGGGYCPDLSGTDPGILPLLAITSSGEIAGSIWWKGLMQGQPNAPVWLLADHLLLLPNHAALPFSSGGIRIPSDLAVPGSVSSEDFLLRMEERERGSLRPDFDSLWDRSVVVIGPSSLLPMASVLNTLRHMTALGAFSLTWQIALMISLSLLLIVLFSLRRRTALILTGMLVAAALTGTLWSLRQGILPPILPWVVASAFSIAAPLTGRGGVEH
jgi:hypothetical protein